MGSASSIKSTSITLSSYVNSAESYYTFTIVATVPVTTSDYLFVTFPVTDVTMPDTLECSTTSSEIIDSLTTCEYHYADLNNLVKETVKIQLKFVSGKSQIDINE